jgi:hypothetical protein
LPRDRLKISVAGIPKAMDKAEGPETASDWCRSRSTRFLTALQAQVGRRGH